MMYRSLTMKGNVESAFAYARDGRKGVGKQAVNGDEDIHCLTWNGACTGVLDIVVTVNEKIGSKTKPMI